MKSSDEKRHNPAIEGLNYEAPQLQFVEVRVERGYALSQQEPSPWEDM
jgi:hypothetical protein